MKSIARSLLTSTLAAASFPAAAGETWVVPGLASAEGRNGARFESTLVLTNGSGSAVEASITFLPPPGTAAAPPARLALAPDETRSVPEALPALFGRTETFGTAIVTAPGPVAVRCVTSNVARPGGRAGLAVAGLRPAELLAAGETGHALWLQDEGETAGARTNVTIALLDAGTAVRLTVRDATGAERGSLDVPANGPATWQAPIATITGGAPLALGRVEARVVAGRATGFLSVVDNVTGDGTVSLLCRAPAGESDWLVDGVARAAGRNGTLWTTDLRLLNPGPAALRVRLDAVGVAPAPVPWRIERDVPPGALLEIADLLGPSGFAVEAGAGAVRVRAGGPLLVAGRTSTPDPSGGGGRLGTGLAPVRSWGGQLTAGHTASLPGLSSASGTSGERSNVALLAGAGGAAGTLALRSAAGALLATAPFALGPLEWRQQELPAWVGAASVPAGSRLDVSVASGLVDAYATLVDNGSGDAVLVTAASWPPPCAGAAPEAATPSVTVTLGAPAGTVRPLLGVNIGPRNLVAGTADLTGAYRERLVTEVRTHDYYGPLDMATLFPSQAADPASPASYEFGRSDAVFASIVDGPFEPYLRLGDSWSAGVGYPPARPRRPTNPDAWVKAAVEVVRHYDDAARWGHRPLRHVEVWNEPDNAQFWDGTREEFLSLFTRALAALKAAHPHLSVGGPGLTPAGALAPQGQAYTRALLDAVKASGAPLDFLSFHVYTNDPGDFARCARFYRQELDARGLLATRLHVTEWNTQVHDASTPDAAALRTGGRGAAILTSGWIALQEAEVAASTLYRGPDPAMDAWWFYGLFRSDGTPKRVADALHLWGRAAAHPDRLAVAVAGAPAGLAALAGSDDTGELAVLVANPSAAPVAWRLSSPPAGGGCARVEEVSDAAAGVVSRAAAGDTFTVPAFAVQLVTLRPPSP